ncbi:hypothetical protein GCM10009676_08790 [Prauserella halophila]|uniref:Uncharacterized protein n=1 Tax=Prauserella halophila TaxID=185641 RepID=A0ABN1VZK4_9PSEU
MSGIAFVSGLHADTTASHARYEGLVASGLPLVFLNGYAEDIAAPFFSDDGAAVERALAHLRSARRPGSGS